MNRLACDYILVCKSCGSMEWRCTEGEAREFIEEHIRNGCDQDSVHLFRGEEYHFALEGTVKVTIGEPFTIGGFGASSENN
jgi:hypothetical protein